MMVNTRNLPRLISGAAAALLMAGGLQAQPVPADARIALGQKIFRGEEASGTCAACHGQDGEGTPMGPALNAGKPIWSNGSAAGIAAVITKGVDQPKNFAAGMPPLGGGNLTPEQIAAVAAYVATLRPAG